MKYQEARIKRNPGQIYRGAKNNFTEELINTLHYFFNWLKSKGTYK
jgi:hypothetical protein